MLVDSIVLKNMVFFGHTGCLEKEKQNGQKFTVTIEIHFDRIKGCETDELEDTVDYADICAKAKEIVESDRGNLTCSVTVGKPDAPVDAVFETMEVRIERTR